MREQPGTGNSNTQLLGKPSVTKKAPLYLPYVGKEKKLSQVDRSTKIRISMLGDALATR
jgi:hypothetical protein